MTWANPFRNLTGGARAVVGLALVSLAPVLYLMLNRLSAGFDIDGGSYVVMHLIDRVVAGQPIYAPSSSDHINGGYTPLYMWICGVLGRMFGAGFFWPRLISVLSALFAAALVGVFVWLNTDRDPVLTLVGPAAFLWTALADGFNTWVVDVNVNALHTALALGAFLLLRPPLSSRKVALSALAMSLSVLAKQTALAYVLAGFVLLLALAPKKALLFAAISAAILGAVFLVLNRMTHGEFYRHTVVANQGPPWIVRRLLDEVVLRVFIGLVGFMAVGTLVHVVRSMRPGFWREMWRAEWFLCAAGVGVACIAHPKIGSGAVQDLVGIAGVIVCGSMGIHGLAKAWPAAGGRLRVWVPALQLALVILWGVRFYPYALIDRVDREKYLQIASVFAAGRTSMYSYLHMQRSFGQEPGGYGQGDIDLWRDGVFQVGRMPDELVRPYREQQFDYVILPAYVNGRDPIIQAVVQAYQPVGRLPGHPRGPVGGNMRYEMFVLKAKRLEPRR